MDMNSKVSVPSGKVGAGMGSIPDVIVKSTGSGMGGIKGFGSGKADSSSVASKENTQIVDDRSGSNGKQTVIDGFNRTGLKGGKI